MLASHVQRFPSDTRLLFTSAECRPPRRNFYRRHFERLGHSTIRLTLDRYGHLLPRLDERLRDGLDDLFRTAQSSR